jgi:F420-dependent oxidoreductase-like protein
VDEIRLSPGSLVVLVGRSGVGKTTWARANFAENEIVSSDRLRAVVGASEGDQRAGKDAFALLHAIVAARLGRRLTTVIDTMALDPEARSHYLGAASAAGVPCHAVVFDAPEEVIAERNAARRWPLPKRTLTAQRRSHDAAVAALDREGFVAVHRPAPVIIVPPDLVDAPIHVRHQQEAPVILKFGLQISAFDWDGGAAGMADRLTDLARAAEEAGFSSLWVMDHFRQIPQLGREWEDMPESYVTLAYLAAVTECVSLGSLVTAVGYRNPAHLGKILATLDVVSGGRAVCGLGLGWYEKEAKAYGWEWPSVSERYDLLEDTLELLPLMWGPGSPAYEGRRITVPEAMCYPRPIQERIPILVGGSGERRTLRIVARHADMCNLFGDPDTVRHKLAVLRSHCAEIGRDPDAIEVTHLSQAMTAADPAGLEERIQAMRGPSQTAAEVAERAGAGSIADQIGRYRALADAGVRHAIVGVPDASDLHVIRAFGDVIDAFR